MTRMLKIIISALLLAGFAVFALIVWNDYEASKERAAVPIQTVEQKPEPKKETPPTVPELLQMVNAERAKAGVAPLAIDTRLNMSAQTKADDMLTNDYFDHVDASGKHGYSYIPEYAPGLCSRGGENIFWGRSTNSSKAATEWWMNSALHKAAILNKDYKLTGFGIADNKVVEHFCIAN